MFKFYWLILIIFNLNQSINTSVIRNSEDVFKNNNLQNEILSDLNKIKNDNNQSINHLINESLSNNKNLNEKSSIDKNKLREIHINNDEIHFKSISNELKIEDNNSNYLFNYIVFGFFFLIIMLILIVLIEPNICFACNCPHNNDFLCVLLCCECFQGCAVD